MTATSLSSRLAHAWNAFTEQRTRTVNYREEIGEATAFRQGRSSRIGFTNERSIFSAVLTRISIDVANVPIRHVRLDNKGRYSEDMDSLLNYCLTVEANIDQPATAFRQDLTMTLLDKGVAALVAVETTFDPAFTNAYDVKSLRVGEIISWHPKHVRVSVYNENTGKREELVLPKKQVAIVENPLYTIMNEPNSTLQRLIRKLNILDAVDEQSGSGKLDLIIQLPYVVKSESRKLQAENRRKDIEFQLRSSKYGIAYTDGTERITQLNRPVENNLLKQVEYLTQMLYSQLGLTEAVMNGTASESEMLNYNNRTIKPILTAIRESAARTFLTKTGRSQGQAIEFYKDPFTLVPIADIAEIADKFTRNEILSANEVRQIIGFAPVTDDPKADQLRNSNMPESELGPQPGDPKPTEGISQNGT